MLRRTSSSFYGLLTQWFSAQLSLMLVENGNRYLMNRIEIRHTTRYDFEAAVTLGPHTLHLRPREGHDLRIAASALDIVPKATLGWRTKYGLALSFGLIHGLGFSNFLRAETKFSSS